MIFPGLWGVNASVLDVPGIRGTSSAGQRVASPACPAAGWTFPFEPSDSVIPAGSDGFRTPGRRQPNPGEGGRPGTTSPGPPANRRGDALLTHPVPDPSAGESSRGRRPRDERVPGRPTARPVHLERPAVETAPGHVRIGPAGQVSGRERAGSPAGGGWMRSPGAGRRTRREGGRTRG